MSLHNQKGYTLLELLIVVVIIGLISVPLTNFSIRSMTSYFRLDAQSHASTDLLMLSNRLTGLLRGATSVETAQDNTITFYAYKNLTDTAVSKYRYFISGTTLSMGIIPPSGTAPDYTYPSGNEVVKVLRSDLVMNGQPAFSYYNEDNNQLTGSFNVGVIRKVSLFFSANPRPKQMSRPIIIQNSVSIRNLKRNL